MCQNTWDFFSAKFFCSQLNISLEFPNKSLFISLFRLNCRWFARLSHSPPFYAVRKCKLITSLSKSSFLKREHQLELSSNSSFSSVISSNVRTWFIMYLWSISPYFKNSYFTMYSKITSLINSHQFWSISIVLIHVDFSTHKKFAYCEHSLVILLMLAL